MRHLLIVVALLAACGHGNDSATGGAGTASTGPKTTPSAQGSGESKVVDSKNPESGSAAPTASADKPAPEPGAADGSADKAAPDPNPPSGHDFTAEAKALLAVGACGDVPIPQGFSEPIVAKHCEVIKAAQNDYIEQWVNKARPFFAEKVPANIPKKVVYPFAGGDLSTALTVYPNAEEITTLSLEPAGDPRTLSMLIADDAKHSAKPAADAKPGDAKPGDAKPGDAKPGDAKPGDAKPAEPAPADPRLTKATETKAGLTRALAGEGSPALARALATVEYELKFLYRVNFSNTLNMIDAMRGGELPTQLIFGLSALKVHGYEVVSLRYFSLDADGAIHYLTDDDVSHAPDPAKGKAEVRNRIFANAELRFRKPGGPVQIYRHIQFNLDDAHLKKDPRVLKHLEAKGPISAMTKAASYLLSWDSFSLIRNYLIGHVQWMVSDATGVAPKWGKAAGFEYETYGGFKLPHIQAGNGIAKDWRTEFEAQPQRELGFRFGYYDKNNTNHLIIMRKKA